MERNIYTIKRPVISPSSLILLILFVALSTFLTGCATASGYGRGWGRDVTILPGWKKIGEAAKDAVLDPRTWIPAAGAAVFGLSNLDDEVSDWARDETPIFGSHANDASDYLMNAALAS